MSYLILIIFHGPVAKGQMLSNTWEWMFWTWVDMATPLNIGTQAPAFEGYLNPPKRAATLSSL